MRTMLSLSLLCLLVIPLSASSFTFGLDVSKPEPICYDIRSVEPDLGDPVAVFVSTLPDAQSVSELVVGNTVYPCTFEEGDDGFTCIVDEDLFGVFKIRMREKFRFPCGEGIVAPINTVIED